MATFALLPALLLAVPALGAPAAVALEGTEAFAAAGLVRVTDLNGRGCEAPLALGLSTAAGHFVLAEVQGALGPSVVCAGLAGPRAYSDAALDVPGTCGLTVPSRATLEVDGDLYTVVSRTASCLGIGPFEETVHLERVGHAVTYRHVDVDLDAGQVLWVGEGTLLAAP
jgi:hypothetical protein